MATGWECQLGFSSAKCSGNSHAYGSRRGTVMYKAVEGEELCLYAVHSVRVGTHSRNR
jgi:hypothetical protein